MVFSAQKRTMALVYFSSIVERADEQVLPSVYFFVGRSLGATPSQLGGLTFCRAIVQALSSPVSGLIGDRFDRTHVIAAGCFLWGLMTSAIATAKSVHQAMIYAGANGVGLALVIPCCQSLIADYHPAETRGRAFGFMQFIGSLGIMVGGVFSTNVGHLTPFGMDGWRVALHSIALLSFVTGFLVVAFAVDPRHGSKGAKEAKESEETVSLLEQGKAVSNNGQGRARPRTSLSPISNKQMQWSGQQQQHVPMNSDVPNGHQKASKFTLGQTLKEIRWVLGIRSFQIVILQGVVGSTPWNAMVFFTLWFQLLGFSDFNASALLAIFNLGNALGGILGGTIADKMSILYPNNGRIFTAQFSVLCGLPFSVVLLKVLPMMGVEGNLTLYGFVLFTMGLLISWCQSGCNSPVFADIVPESLYSKIYAFDRSFEGAIAATAAPLVGFVSEHLFGFSGDVSEGRGEDKSNAESLGNSLLLCLVVPWFLCFLFYGGLHWSYPRDRLAAKDKDSRRDAI
ncbi:hypothetical protein BSKO_04485 [Bryopsis sp. KO-2023]|nr:hypothetical protein BSKO_04485 [Bryopsis sp. KO-2023]